MSITDQIKDYALDLGYSAVGIASAEPFPQYTQSLEERAEDYSTLTHLSSVADPRNSMPGAKSIVVAIYDFFQEGFPSELIGKISRAYQSRSFMAPPTRIHGARPQLMRQFLEGLGSQVGPWRHTFTGVPDRQAAVRAGVGQFGRNTLVCTPKLGTFVLISPFLIDKELTYDQPLDGLHCPPTCHLCQDACPTGAIVSDVRLNPKRCIGFNNFATQGGKGASAYIPKEIREKMGTSIHGCDRCQDVCPRNQVKLKAKPPVNPYLAKKAAEFDLFSLLALNDDYYARVVQPLMYYYIRDPKFFRRNAAVALGNLGDLAAVPALILALNDPEEVVRAHVAWALGRLGGRQARAALETARDREAGEVAKQEIEEALLALS